MSNFPIVNEVAPFQEIIKDYDNFIEIEKDGTLIFDYLYSDKDNFLENPLLREMRGIIFDDVTKKVISRPYHKFFNLNETPETKYDVVNWLAPHVILDKLDGSMIRFYRTSDGKLHCGTKKGETDVASPAKDYALKNPKLMEFINYVVDSGNTPIFEWCSRYNKIVLDYPSPKLILTGIRNNENGEYYDYINMCKWADDYEVEVVKSLSVDDISKLIDRMKQVKDIEGYVIRFDDGLMIKIKCDWYIRLHRLYDSLRFEKDLIYLILDDNLDDVEGKLPPDVADSLFKFNHDIHAAIAKHADDVVMSVSNGIKNEWTRKEFGMTFGCLPDKFLYFSVLDHINANGGDFNDMTDFYILKDYCYNLIIETVKRHALLGANKLEKIRNLFGNLYWKDYYVIDNLKEEVDE